MGKRRETKSPGGAGTGAASSRSSTGGGGLDNVYKVKGTNFYRDAKKVRQVNMYKGGKPTRNKDGRIIKPAEFQSRLASGTVARVQPNRRWFENTRTIGQKELTAFREAMSDTLHNPYTVIMRQNKLPMSLITNHEKNARMNILEVETFSNTFGPKSQRKRPKLLAASMQELAQSAVQSEDKYEAEKDPSLLANVSQDGTSDETRDPIFQKGQSKRIWNELYKVIDSSDVVIHVLDARDPLGTRCRNVESYLKKEAPHKHLIFVLNKCDLVPTWVTAKWVRVLSAEYPTLAFHASINNSFGKGSLIQLLRQFAKLHSDKKQISVGFIGYPNTGKSSIINTLRKKKVCNVAPIPGETKVWQYITLMNRIYLIDCPGVVHPSTTDSETDIVLRGVVRVENIKTPDEHIPAILERVKREYIQKTYGIENWEDHVDFLNQVARNTGKLLKGGEPDHGTVSKMILNDWLRGKIPFFTLPPADADTDADRNQQKQQESASNKISVQQIFSKINVSANFSKSDLDKDSTSVAATSEETQKDSADSTSIVATSDDKDEDDVDEEKITDWDEVFKSVVGDEIDAPSLNGDVEDDGAEDEDEEGDDTTEVLTDTGVDEVESDDADETMDAAGDEGSEDQDETAADAEDDVESSVERTEAESAVVETQEKDKSSTSVEEDSSESDTSNIVASFDSNPATSTKPSPATEDTLEYTAVRLGPTTLRSQRPRAKPRGLPVFTVSEMPDSPKQAKKKPQAGKTNASKAPVQQIPTQPAKSAKPGKRKQPPALEDSVSSSPSDSEDEIESASPSPSKKRRQAPKVDTTPLSDSEDDSESTRGKKTKKAPRMTTNKGKVGLHYYETANVKNRNKNKVKVSDKAKELSGARRGAKGGKRKA
ncbi:GTPase required for pre-60S ribosomal subunit nuclear export and maturation [Quaeritorhiza haematococci]|nr:GTPase required for pre-60S ribosomal subunit nuclear export and maturation [Quaeritorhiza haematococci]